MALDNAIGNVFSNVLLKFGRSATFTQITTSTSVAIKCSPPSPFDRRLVDGRLILEGDLQTIVMTKDLGTLVPEQFDTLLMDSVTYTVQGVSPISGTQSIVAYTLHLRR